MDSFSWPTWSDHLEMQMLLMQKQTLTAHSGSFAPCSLSTTHWYKLILFGTSLEAWLGWAIKPAHKTHDTAEAAEAVTESSTQCCSCMSYLHVYTYWMRWREWLLWSCQLFKSKNVKLSLRRIIIQFHVNAPQTQSVQCSEKLQKENKQ